MRAEPDYSVRGKTQRLADLKSMAEALQQEIDHDRMVRQFGLGHGYDEPDFGYDDGDYPDQPEMSQPRGRRPRTESILNGGRRTSYRSYRSYRRRVDRRQAVAIAVAAGLAIAAALAFTMSRGGASWPASVATVQAEIGQACQNADVRSEPGEVNFACAPATRQVLWVFALMMSADNPHFTDPATGRLGLEPITPAQGGQVAWTLNLHHPYDPFNPVDSLAVAARAINSIVGGATVTGATGNPVVQAGLEGYPGNCLRYTGSAALSSRAGFPSLCARPVTTTAGQAALVADVYQKWIVGASPKAAQDAAVLFENASDPGNPQVQAILAQLGH